MPYLKAIFLRDDDDGVNRDMNGIYRRAKQASQDSL